MDNPDADFVPRKCLDVTRQLINAIPDPKDVTDPEDLIWQKDLRKTLYKFIQDCSWVAPENLWTKFTNVMNAWLAKTPYDPANLPEWQKKLQRIVKNE